MARVVDLAKAVRDHLNAQTFNPNVTATRGVFESQDVTEMVDPLLQVFIGPTTKTTAGRCKTQRVYGIYVVLRQYVSTDGDEVETVDGLIDLAEQIEDSLDKETMASFAAVDPDVTIFDNAEYVTEVLQQQNTFMRVISLAYVYID